MKLHYLQNNKELYILDEASRSINSFCIELVFTTCDLYCKFCPNIDIPEEDIDARLKNCLINFDKALSHCTASDISVTITGTELFQDRFSDEQIAHILAALQEINNIIDKYKKNATLYLESHLIIKKLDRILPLLLSKKYIVYTSFDFADRFSKLGSLELFFKNCKILKDAGINLVISTVCHKKTINAFFNKEPLYYTWLDLYNKGYTLDFCLWQVTSHSEFNVTFEDQVKFFSFLYENYKDLLFFERLKGIKYLSKIERIDCASTIGIDNNKIKYRRCSIEDKAKYTKLFEENHQCYTCSYYKNCNKLCVCEHYKEKDCLLKALLDIV
jgi:hypothetical protein